MMWPYSDASIMIALVSASSSGGPTTGACTAVALVRAGYEDLIALRDKLSPGTHLIFQGYDFPIPDGRLICHLGPWLKPTFDLREFPTRAAAQEVVKAMLKEFAAMLTSLATQPKVTFINGQGTLPVPAQNSENQRNLGVSPAFRVLSSDRRGK